MLNLNNFKKLYFIELKKSSNTKLNDILMYNEMVVFSNKLNKKVLIEFTEKYEKIIKDNKKRLLLLKAIKNNDYKSIKLIRKSFVKNKKQKKNILPTTIFGIDVDFNDCFLTKKSKQIKDEQKIVNEINLKNEHIIDDINKDNIDVLNTELVSLNLDSNKSSNILYSEVYDFYWNESYDRIGENLVRGCLCINKKYDKIDYLIKSAKFRAPKSLNILETSENTIKNTKIHDDTDFKKITNICYLHKIISSSRVLGRHEVFVFETIKLDNNYISQISEPKKHKNKRKYIKLIKSLNASLYKLNRKFILKKKKIELERSNQPKKYMYKDINCVLSYILNYEIKCTSHYDDWLNKSQGLKMEKFVIYNNKNLTDEELFLLRSLLGQNKSKGQFSNQLYCTYSMTKDSIYLKKKKYKLNAIEYHSLVQDKFFIPKLESYFSNELCFFYQSSITYSSNRQIVKTEWDFKLSNLTNLIENMNREFLNSSISPKKKIRLLYTKNKNKKKFERLIENLIKKFLAQRRLNSN